MITRIKLGLGSVDVPIATSIPKLSVTHLWVITHSEVIKLYRVLLYSFFLAHLISHVGIAHGFPFKFFNLNFLFMFMTTFTVFIVFTPCLLSIILAINLLLPINKPDLTKLSPYECGMDTIGTARDKFNVLFYLVAILFLIFDVEILFLFPFATVISSPSISFFGFWVSIVFLIFLTLGFIYELSKDILNFNSPLSYPFLY